jgi:tetratricopeptide (TPR) repeat protein
MLIRSALVALCLGLAAVPANAQSTVVELNEAGWKALQRGESVQAARMFAEALAKLPDDPVLLFGAGAAAHLQGKSREAIDRLQRALRLEPDLIPAALLLGEIVYAQGDVALAIATYERALKHAPNHRDLTERLEHWRTEADVHRGFAERRHDRFRVMFQGRADEPLAAEATGLLDAAFWDIGKTLGAYPSEPVVLMLYTEQQFRDVTQAPEWAGGLYDGRIRVPAAGAALSPQLFQRVLTHELAHAMIATIAPQGVPAWLHEGLAQYFEGDDPEAARRRLKAVGQVIPLRALERSFSRLTASQARVAYDESLVVVDAILRRPGFSLSELLRALSESNRTEYTFDNFGLTYLSLEEDLRKQ